MSMRKLSGAWCDTATCTYSDTVSVLKTRFAPLVFADCVQDPSLVDFSLVFEDAVLEDSDTLSWASLKHGAELCAVMKDDPLPPLIEVSSDEAA